MDSASFTDFLRRSGDVLKRLARGDIILERRDGEDLVLTTVSRTAAREGALGQLADLALEILRSPGGEDVVLRALADTTSWTSLLNASERRRFITELARSAAASVELDSPWPLAHTAERWHDAAAERSRTFRPGIDARPVAVPDDVDSVDTEKASGVVTLPLHIRWSGPDRSYDLGDPVQLRRVYEQVLREGSADDVRRFIDVDSLLEHWDQLVLPPRVRRAWSRWLSEHRGVDLAC